MYWVNKIALFLVNPISLGIGLFGVALLLQFVFRRHRAAWIFVGIGCAWFTAWSMPVTGLFVGWLAGLDEYAVTYAQDLPVADAIVDLGGGVCRDSRYDYADMQPGSDRAWHTARLWKAGKAPIVITSGKGTGRTDGEILREMGVPEDAICVDDDARNTEENAIFTQKLLKGRMGIDKPLSQKPRVLIVTSIYHMKRAMMIFRKAAPELECVAAGTDYGSYDPNSEFNLNLFYPAPGTLAGNMVVYKEWLGVLGYKLRGF